MGIKASSADIYLYVSTMNEEMFYLVVYADDSHVGCHGKKEISRVYEVLSKHFKIVCLGDVKYFLGLEVGKDNGINNLSSGAVVTTAICIFLNLSVTLGKTQNLI